MKLSYLSKKPNLCCNIHFLFVGVIYVSFSIPFSIFSCVINQSVYANNLVQLEIFSNQNSHSTEG